MSTETFTRNNLYPGGLGAGKRRNPRQLRPSTRAPHLSIITSEQMGRLFDLESERLFCTRLANPTNEMRWGRRSVSLRAGRSHADLLGARRLLYAVLNICQAGTSHRDFLRDLRRFHQSIHRHLPQDGRGVYAGQPGFHRRKS